MIFNDFENKQIKEKKGDPFKVSSSPLACSLVRGSRLNARSTFEIPHLLFSLLSSFLSFFSNISPFSLSPYLTFLTSSNSEIFISSNLFPLIPCQAALPVSIFSLKFDIFTFFSSSRRSFVAVGARIKSQKSKFTLPFEVGAYCLTRHEIQAVLSSPILNFGPLS